MELKNEEFIIKDVNFIIKYSNVNYILYLKNNNNNFDIKGYYTSLESVIKKLTHLKIIKNSEYLRIKKINNDLKSYSNSIYDSINQLVVSLNKNIPNEFRL